MKKVLFFLMIALLCLPLAMRAQVTLTVADGTNTNGYVPVYGYYCDTEGNKTQTIYPASDLSEMAGGTISGLTYYLSSPASAAWGATFEVKLTEITESTFSSEAAMDVSSATVVYTGELDGTGSTMTIAFDQDYTYNGGNLLVDITLIETGSWKSAFFYGVTTTTDVSYNEYESWGYTYSTLISFIPKTTFTYTPASTGCDMPTSITVNFISPTGATVDWEGGGSAWNLRYKASTDDEWSLIEGLTTTSYTFNNTLVSNTTYSVGVQTVCGSTSSFFKSTSFTTPCSIVSIPAAGWTENFDDLTVESNSTAPSSRVLPDCWRAINTTSYSYYSYSQLPSAFYYSYSNSANSTPNCLKFYSFTDSGYDSYYDPKPQYAILPMMEDLTGKQITLQARGYDANSTFKIGTMTDPTDATTFTLITEQTGLTTSYQEFTYPLSGTNVCVAIMIDAASSTRTTNGVYIDDIVIEDAPNCIKPISLNVTASGQTATFTWTSDATEWQVAHATSATAEPNDNIVTSTPINTTNYSMEDLALDEDPYFWVRTYCGAAEQSEWAGPASVHIGYCVPNPSSHDGSGITGVSFGTGDYVVTNGDGSASLPATSPFYGDYSSMTGAVQAGVESTIAITTGTNTYPYTFVIWVDLDNSLSFEDSEILYIGKAPSGNGTFNATITIPATQAEGDYRMRIYGADSYFNNFYNNGTTNWEAAHDPCNSGTYRHAHDYTLHVLEAPACLTPTALTLSRDNDQITATWDGSASTYNIDINGTVTNDVTSPHTFTADLSTTYTVKVQANCSGETSDWSNTQSITTPACWAGRIINYTLNDSWGDGWNGAAIYVKEGCVNIDTLTVTASSTSGTLELCGDYYEFIWKSGSFDSECSFTFTEGETTLFTKPSTVSDGLVLYTIGTLTCPAPTNLVKETPAARSVVLNWNENGEATQWVVAYKTATETEFNELVVGEHPYTLENLTPATPYIVKVLSKCSDVDVSCWSNSVNFTTPVACPAPTDLTAGTPGPDHVQLSWTKNGSETAWQIYISDNDVAPVDDIALAEVRIANSNPYNLEGLEPEHHYYVWVRANCGDIDGTSAWEGPEDFTTAANCPTPVLAADAFSDISGHAATVTWTGFTQNSNYTVWYRVPEHINGLVEEFNTSSIPTDWTRSNTPLTDDVLNGTTSLNSSTSGWNFGTANGVFDSHARMNIYGTSKYWLVSPKVTLSTNSLLSFDLALTAYSGTLAAPDTTGTDDRFVVLISADEGSTWTILRQWDNNPGSTYVYNDIASSATGENVEFDLSAYDGNDVKIAFYGESTASNADNNLHIDNVAIGTLIPAGEWQTQNVSAPDPFTSTPSTTLTGLDPVTTYEVKVTANCGTTETDGSAIRTFTTDVACPTPTNLTFVNATTNSATVKWNSPSDINSWYVYYKAKGDPAFNSVNVDDSTTTITGLEPGTIYVVKVTADCSANNDGESDESDSITFATECVEIAANGYTESFDNTTAGNNVLPVCWSSINETTYNSEKSYPTIYSYSSYNTPNCLRFYSTYSTYYGNSNPQPQYAILPQMTGLGDNLRIKFQAKGYNANSTFKIGRMTDPTNASTFVPFTIGEGDEQALTTSYQEFVYNITGNGDYLAIMIDAASSSRTTNGVYIDTILIEPIPSCVEPSDLAVVGEEGNPGTNTVKLSWTPGGTEEEWDIYFSTSNTAPIETTEPSVSGVTNNPETVDGLDAATTYYVWVRAHCSDADKSPWIGGISFTTEFCDAADQCELTFELTDTWGDGWNGNAIRVTDVETGLVIADMENENLNGTSGSGENELNIKTLAVCNGREIRFSWVSGTYASEASYVVKDVNGEEIFSGSGILSNPVTYTVNCAITDCKKPTDLAYTELKNHSVKLSWTDNVEATAWVVAYQASSETNFTEVNVTTNPYTLTGLAAETEYTVKVRPVCDDDFIKWSDEVTFTTLEACPAPTNFEVTSVNYINNITFNSAELGWNVGDDTQTAWQIAYKAGEDFDPTDEADLATATIVDADENPFTIEGLQPETTYYAYVRANCSATDKSNWSNVDYFTTLERCPTPGDGDVENVTQTSAEVYWYGESNSYNVRYRTKAHTIGIEEDFYSSSIPDGWLLRKGALNNDGTATLTGTDSWTIGYKNDVFDNHIWMNLYTTSASKDYWCITPSMTVNNGDALSFDMAYTGYYGGDPVAECPTHRFAVLISTDNKETWTILREWNNSGSAYVLDNVSPTGENSGPIDLSAYEGESAFFAFYGHAETSDYDNNFHFDNVIIGTQVPAGQWTVLEDLTPEHYNNLENGYVTTLTNLLPGTEYEAQVQANCTDDEGESTSEWSYSYEFTTLPPYVVTVTVNPANAGITVTGDGEYTDGQTAHIAPDNATGYHIVNWTDAYDSGLGTGDYIDIVVVSDTTIIAIFDTNVYNVDIILVGPGTENNFGDVDGPATIKHFLNADYTAMPEYGYLFQKWTDEAGTELGTNEVLNIAAVSDTTVKAVFVYDTFAIAGVSADELMGTVYGSNDKAPFHSNVDLTATPELGYRFVEWIEADTLYSDIATISVAVIGNRTLTAYFEQIDYSITATVDPANSGSVEVPVGPFHFGDDPVTLKATAAEGYTFVNWTEADTVYSTDSEISVDITTSDREFIAHFEQIDYSITATVAPVGAGTVEGTGNEFHYGEETTLTATPNTGYYFVNWTENDQIVSIEDSYLVSVTGDRAFVAHFDTLDHEIITGFQPTGGGTVTGAGTYKHFKTATLTATANDGYTFTKWSDNVTDNPRIVTVVSDSSFEAIFTLNTYVVNVSINPAGSGDVYGTAGTATFVPGDPYAYGTQISLTAVPDENKEFVNWTENGVSVSTDNPYEFELTAARSLTANFKNMDQVAIPDFSPAAGTIFLHYDENQTVTLSCNTEDATIYYTTDGTTPTANSTAYTNGITVNNGTEVTIKAIAMKTGMQNSGISTATYKIVPLYDVTISDAISHGSASADHQTAAKDSVVTLAATPAEHYHFDSWHVTSGNDVITVTNNQFTMPAGNVVVSAIFELDTFQVNVTVNPDNTGSVTGTVGAATTSTTAFENGAYYAYNTHITLTATPATNKEFVSWTEGGVEISTNATIAFDVTAERNLVANFKAMGQVEAPTFQPVAGTYHEAQSVTINCATADATIYYTMNNSEPTINSTPYTGAITTTSNGIDTIKAIAVKEGMVNSEVSVAVYEIIPQYTITVAANPTEGGDVGGDGTYNHGESVTLEVVAVEEGYTFNNWTLNGNVVSEDPSYTFDVTADGDYVANFTQNTYEITVSANPQNGGTVFGGGTYIHGETATLIATPSTATGYTFNNWTLNGNVVSEDPSYTFYVTADGDYVANFTLNTQTLTIHYQYEDGTAVGDDTVKQVNIGSTYNVVSPEIDCYVADKLNVTGTMGVEEVKDTVTYTSLATTGIDERVVCDSLKWIDGNTYFQSTNTPTYTLVNVAGCDSVVTLHLTINTSPAEPGTFGYGQYQL